MYHAAPTIPETNHEHDVQHRIHWPPQGQLCNKLFVWSCWLDVPFWFVHRHWKIDDSSQLESSKAFYRGHGSFHTTILCIHTLKCMKIIQICENRRKSKKSMKSTIAASWNRAKLSLGGTSRLEMSEAEVVGCKLKNNKKMNFLWLMSSRTDKVKSILFGPAPTNFS